MKLEQWQRQLLREMGMTAEDLEPFGITPVVSAEPVRPFPKTVEQAEEVYHETIRRAAEEQGEFRAIISATGTAALL